MVLAALFHIPLVILGIQQVHDEGLTDIGAGGASLEWTLLGAAEQLHIGELPQRGFLEPGDGDDLAPILSVQLGRSVGVLGCAGIEEYHRHVSSWVMAAASMA